MIGGESGICSFGGVYIYHTLMRCAEAQETDSRDANQSSMYVPFRDPAGGCAGRLVMAWLIPWLRRVRCGSAPELLAYLHGSCADVWRFYC